MTTMKTKRQLRTLSHGSEQRGLTQAPPLSRHSTNAGMFGRMLNPPPSEVFTADPAILDRLAEHMRVTPQGGADNERISAGYTFLGQFIDHDITFDPTSSLERQNDPDAIFNFRTPLLELDSLYGAGPDIDPYLYDENSLTGKFLIGQDAGSPNGVGEDLPRNRQGVALIGDKRNDENLIVSQLHMVFLKFHNAVVDLLASKSVAPNEIFARAQRLVRWHYQWIVVNEFLPRIVGQPLVDELFTNSVTANWQDRLKLFTAPLNTNNEPFIPVEFSVAAYRFGHSQVRARYSISNTFQGIPLFDSAGGATLHLPDISTDDGILRANWNIGWGRFFEMDNDEAAPGLDVEQTDGFPQLSKQIDTTLSDPLFTLPNMNPAVLAFRNLQRGVTFSLPNGQWIAREKLGVSEDDILKNTNPIVADGSVLTGLGLPEDKWPLWFYILKEAEVQVRDGDLRGGLKLGQLGGRIVAETFAAILFGDPMSYLNHSGSWTPFSSEMDNALVIKTKNPTRFTMPDLIRFALGENDRRTGIAGERAGQ